MAYPILAEKNTWWAPTVSTVKKANITEIEIKDSYTPDASVTVVDSWDASAAKDGSITCYVIGTKLIIAGNGSGKIAANENSTMCFAGGSGSRFTAVTTMRAMDLLDVSNVKSMVGMLGNCNALEFIDLSNWDVSNVTDMTMMFYVAAQNGKLTSLDLSHWQVSNVTSMLQMFVGCTSLTSVGDLSNWDVSSATNLSGMFASTKVTSVGDLSNWDVSNVTNLSGMFQECTNLISVGDLSNWNTTNVTNTSYMFGNCLVLDTIGDLSNWDVSNVTDMSRMFAGCNSLLTLDLSNWNVSKVKDMRLMFIGCIKLTKVGNLTNWNTASVTNMKSMFAETRSLIKIDLSNWDVSNVTDMSAMFTSGENYGGGTYTEINVSNWNPSSCTDMAYMFYGQTKLKTLDVSKWDVSKVTNFHHMFCWCTQLIPIGVENWNTESAIYLDGLFHGNKHTSLDLSGWDVSKVQSFAQLFENNTNLTEIKGLDKWNTSAGKGFDEMFVNCPKLTELDLSSFDTRNASSSWTDPNNEAKGSMSRMFEGMNNLKKITLGENFSFKGDGSCTAAVLPTPSTDYIEGADGNWYTLIGESYAPAAVKDKTAETYYASYDIVANMDVICKNGSLLDAAKAIREKNGSTERYTPAQFGAAIRALN